MDTRILSRQPISKGWSSDRKYKVKFEDGRFGLLRVADLTAFEGKRSEFSLMQKLAAKGCPISQPLDFWTDTSYVYSVFEWLDGQDMVDVAAVLSDQELYDLGRQAGMFLRTLHSLPIDQAERDWNTFYQAKIDKKIAAYQASEHSYKSGQLMIDFIQANRHLLSQRPIAHHHGDFHTGNFLLGEDRHLKILDFDRHDIGDPWEEFNRIIFTASLSSAFACGQIDSYFEENIPKEFWPLLALYLTVNSLGALSWAEREDPAQIPLMKEQAELVGHWFSGYKTIVPTWYSK